jgi:hypothetical protein
MAGGRVRSLWPATTADPALGPSQFVAVWGFRVAGSGPAPKAPGTRRGRRPLARGDWQMSPDIGWQHGDIPAPPDGLPPSSVAAWNTWFGAWWAAHWGPWDVPGLRCVVRLYNAMETGDFARAGEYRMWADNYGITPKGRQDHRWLPPVAAAPASPTPDRYGHLRAVR